MNSRSKAYSQMKYEEGMKTIRSRLNDLNGGKTSTMIKPALTNFNYLKKLSVLQEQCSSLLSEVQNTVFSQRELKTRFENLKQDLLREWERTSRYNMDLLNILDSEIKKEIGREEIRREELDRGCLRNTQEINKIKIELADLKNRISSIQYTLGTCS